jgi:drug/metabolite transporter (DMT)-like permease
VSRLQLAVALCFALIAFAANSVLCRLALGGGSIDAGAFTAIRICSGALALLLLVRGRTVSLEPQRWPAAIMLFAYAACFSFAYLKLTAGTGALLLFGAVQVTMLAGGLLAGERPAARAWFGWALAFAGLIYLVAPGVEAPPLREAGLMAAAGVAWGVYSLFGRGNADPVSDTARNFVLAAPMSIGLLMATHKISGDANWDGVAYAATSGALTSGLGYVLWYFALRHITSVSAAIAQLTVPVIAALGGVVVLSEAISGRLAISALVILGGVAIGLSSQKR